MNHSEYYTVIPQNESRADMHQFVIGAVAPRPIAFVSSMDKEGNRNLAPYSFFNAFSSNPPMLIFSSNLKPPDAGKKDTLNNILETMDCVINIVDASIVRQAALCSVNFPKDEDEFVKAGLTTIDSEFVRPSRVAESPIQMECKVLEIKPMGIDIGSAQLVICVVIAMHIRKDLLNEKNRIDPQKLKAVGRMGRTNYIHAYGDVIESIYQSTSKNIIGFDGLPEGIRTSDVLTGNELSQLAAIETMPSAVDVEAFKNSLKIDKLKGDKEMLIHLAKSYLEINEPEEALKILMILQQ